MALWPLIAFGGINRHQTGDPQASKTATRVQAFFNGDWAKWLDVLERPKRKLSASKETTSKAKAAKAAAALEKTSIGALSRANAELNAKDDLRCEPPVSTAGQNAFKASFGVKHQVAGGSLGEDSRAQLQGFAHALDAAATSAYAGALAGYPRWLLIHVLHPHLVVFLCKAKDNAREKVAKFYRISRGPT